MHLNQDLGFDEVRWAISRDFSPDFRLSFDGPPKKTMLLPGTQLFRLVRNLAGYNFDGVWWMPKEVFEELRHETDRASHGSGRMLRNYIVQSLAIQSGSSQLYVIEIELTRPVFAWGGKAAGLFGRPGGMDQYYLPNLPERGNPVASPHAKVRHTHSLRF